MNLPGTSSAMTIGMRRTSQVAMAVGIVGWVLGAACLPDAAATQLLLAGVYGVCLGLAGALFLALHYVTGAAWSAPLRRVPEAMTALLPLGGALVLAALVAYPSLYPWTNHDVHLHGELKHFWLRRGFFLGRAAAYLVLWTTLACALVAASRRQSLDPEASSSPATRRWAALFLIVFGATFWLASYDWLMSREPNWVSTVYGLYNFAGLFTSGWAAFTLVVLLQRRRGPLRTAATEDRLHDLGRLLFGMIVFWAYLWYCQYMLIWFVNNPEETPHYIRRLEGTWGTLFCLNAALNGVIPFFVLLPRTLKRNPKALAGVCTLVLLGRWLDLYLMIFPEDQGLSAWAVAAAATLGAVGLYVFVLFRTFGRIPSISRIDLPPVAERFGTEHQEQHSPIRAGGDG